MKEVRNKERKKGRQTERKVGWKEGWLDGRKKEKNGKEVSECEGKTGRE